MRIKVDSGNEVDSVQPLSVWLMDLFYDADHPDLAGTVKGIKPEQFLANLVELLVEKGILSLHDVAKITNNQDKITPFPE